MIITLCMIVKDEADIIKSCLDNALKFVDNAVIVDTGSSDNTIEIVKTFGEKVKVVKEEWKEDFSVARNKSLQYAEGEWILILDADEELRCNPQTLREIIANTVLEGFDIPLSNILTKDAELLKSQAYARLFRNSGYTYYRAIHEQLNIDRNKIGSISRDICEIIHYGYTEEKIRQRNKVKRNISILEKELQKNPSDSFIHYHMASSYASNSEYSKALQHYIISYELGLKNGFGEYYYVLVKSMCQCIYLLGDYALCIQFIYQLLSDNRLSNFVDLHYLLSNCYYKINEYIRALDVANKCITIGERTDYPTVEGRGSYLVYLLIARIYRKIGDKLKTLKFYEKSLEFSSKLSDYDIREASDYIKREGIG